MTNIGPRIAGSALLIPPAAALVWEIWQSRDEHAGWAILLATLIGATSFCCLFNLWMNP